MRIHHFSGHVFFYVLQTKMVIASGSENNVSLRQALTSRRGTLYIYVSCLSCSLSNLLASHFSQVLALFRVLFVQALQTSSKTTAIWLVTCIIGRAKNLGLLGQSLLSSQLFMRSQFGWSFASCTLSRHFLFVYEGCPSRILLPKLICIHAFVPGRRELSQMS